MLGRANLSGGTGGKSFIITFTTTPEDATIILKDEKGITITPTIDKIYKLKTGTYTYDVTAAGYFSKADQKLSVLEDEEVIVTLEKELYVTFNLTPENATVEVKDNDGQIVNPEVGTQNKFKLKKGAYKYSVAAEGYFQVDDVEFSMNDDDVDKTISVKIDKKLYVTFVLNPTDATLEVKNGEGQVLIPQDDHTYEVKAGMYSYSCSADNYEPVENVAFEMTEDEEQKTINITLLKPVYGVRRKIGISSTAWERIESGIGKIANAQTSSAEVQNDFDNIAPWKDIKSCDISADGTINAYIGDPTYNPENPKGYIMTEVPEFWYKREQTGGYEYIYISHEEQDGYTKSSKFYIGRYTASGTSSAITSKSGVADLVNLTIVDFRTAAKKVGTNWGQLDILRWSTLQMLYLVEYADYNSQNALGYGVCNGSKINSGGCDTLLMKSGCLTNDKKNAVIYRGIENIFGNVVQWCDGINFKDSQAWVCTDPTKYESDKFASPYTKLSWRCPNSIGYIKEVGYDANFPALQLTKITGGSDSTYIPDYSVYNSGSRVLYVGGNYYDDLECGLWYLSLINDSSHTSLSFGGRLLYTPEQ